MVQIVSFVTKPFSQIHNRFHTISQIHNRFHTIYFENLVYNNTIINIPDPSEALHLRNGASEQNTLYSNSLIGINGQRISLDEPEKTEGAEENNTGNNEDEEAGSTDSGNDSGDGEDESDSNNDGETTGSNEEVE